MRQREFDRYGEIVYTDPILMQKSENFINWAADYDSATGIANRTLKAHEHWLSKTSQPVLELRGDLTTAKRIELITNKLKRM